MYYSIIKIQCTHLEGVLVFQVQRVHHTQPHPCGEAGQRRAKEGGGERGFGGQGVQQQSVEVDLEGGGGGGR